MSVKAKLKIILKANDTIVAESEDNELWQQVLTAINTPKDHAGQADTKKIGEQKNQIGNDPLSQFADYLKLPVDLIKGALSPELEPPYLHLDKHHWEAMKKNLPERGAKAIADVTLAATILLVWKEKAKLGETNPKEATTILSNLGIQAKNPSRSFENSEWIQLRGNKLIINPAQTSKSVKLVKAFCLKKDPYTLPDTE